MKGPPHTCTPSSKSALVVTNNVVSGLSAGAEALVAFADLRQLA